MNPVKIYFCASITGGRDDASIYRVFIDDMKKYASVLTEHIGNLDILGEKHVDDREIHDRDLAWLYEADIVIAEVTQPSLGVGYELGRATEWGKPILCLYRPSTGKRLSGMIAGSDGIELKSYQDPAQALTFIREYVALWKDLFRSGD